MVVTTNSSIAGESTGKTGVETEPCTYVIIIGNNKYFREGSSLNLEDLTGACQDARCLENAFGYRAKMSKRKQVVFACLLDATAETIRDAIKKAPQRLTPNSNLMVFFSGHSFEVKGGWTYIVPATPSGYEDYIPLESFLQECIEQNQLKYIHTCCFFFSCRRLEKREHFPEAKMVELDETNSYICVYLCRQGEGLTDWCHAALSCSFLLHHDEICELGSLLTKFKEESEFLSLGSVEVNYVPDEIRETVVLFDNFWNHDFPDARPAIRPYAKVISN